MRRTRAPWPDLVRRRCGCAAPRVDRETHHLPRPLNPSHVIMRYALPVFSPSHRREYLNPPCVFMHYALEPSLRCLQLPHSCSSYLARRLCHYKPKAPRSHSRLTDQQTPSRADTCPQITYTVFIGRPSFTTVHRAQSCFVATNNRIHPYCPGQHTIKLPQPTMSVIS